MTNTQPMAQPDALTSPYHEMTERACRALIVKLAELPRQALFTGMAKTLGAIVGVRYVIIALRIDPTTTRLRTVAVVNDGKLETNFSYDSSSNPCDQVLNLAQDAFHSENLNDLFPVRSKLPNINPQSYMGVPLLDKNGNAIGLIALMDDKPFPHDQSLNLALHAYASRAETELALTTAEQTIDKLTEGYGLPASHGFFDQLAKTMADSFQMDFAVIGKLSSITSTDIESVSVYHRGKFLDPLQYSLENSPCETVVGKQSQAYITRVQQQFPEFQLLKDLNIEGYVGSPLFDSDNNPIGLLVMLNQQPIEQADNIKFVMEAFAQRASIELARVRDDEYLQYYREIISSSDDLMALIDRNYIYHAANESYCRFFGRTSSEVVKHSVIEVYGEAAFQDGIKENIDASLNGTPVRAERWITSGSGAKYCIQGQYNPYYNAKNEIVGLVMVERDITGFKHVQNELYASEQRLQSLYDDTPSMFFTLDHNATIVSVNAYAKQELGYDIEDIVGRQMHDLSPLEDRDRIDSYYQQCFVGTDQINEWEVRKLHKSGDIVWVKETARVVTNERNEKELFIVSEDISEKYNLAQQLSHQASHDSLTGLINRREFEIQLQALLDNKSGEPSVLCYLDLDQFKIINDACGHLAGDRLLKTLADILRLKTGKQDLLARLGGDEFGLLMTATDIYKALENAETIRRAIAEYRFVWEGRKYSTGVSIGLVTITPETGTVTQVMGMVDAACYAAKDAGRNRLHVYHENDREIRRYRNEMLWANRVTEALLDDSFILYGQKIISIDQPCEGQMLELLIRLQGDQLILPSTFLAAAEHYNLAPRIDQWVISKAFDWLSGPAINLDSLHFCTINLSGQSLGEQFFLEFVLSELERYQLPGHKVCFEITETAAIANLDSAIGFIEQLKIQGCRFALDDFGSGLSSFAYLKNLPVDFIKIDGAFVKDIANNPIDYAMVRSINDIAQVMGKKTIAEFVEDSSTLGILKEIGVDYAQGFGINMPCSIEEFSILGSQASRSA